MQNGFDKMDLPLISIIIPVYKVEDKIRKCIESVLGQTYENLEIILVDDGSPDASGLICDEYAKLDKRICVVHKTNGGQSTARNVALKLVTGQYIGFVDSDDYISPDMYETLYGELVLNNADIAVCGFIKVFEGGEQGIENPFHRKEIIQAEEVMNIFLVDEKIGSHPCNKLFKAELFSSILFPEGRVYEDLAILHKVFHRAQRVVCLPDNKYYYCIHKGSTSFIQNSKWAFGLYQAFADRVEYIKTLDIPQEVFEICLSKASGFAIAGVSRWKQKNADEALYIKSAREFLKKHKTNLFNNKHINKKRKIKIFLIIYMFFIFKLFYK